MSDVSGENFVVNDSGQMSCVLCLMRALIGLSGGYFECCLVYLEGTLNVFMSFWKEL